MNKAIIILFLSSVSLQCIGQISDDYFGQRIDERRNMVYRDIANYEGINISDDKVLSAMFKVPRHAFVTQQMQPHAYQNRPLPIGFNQTISQPVIVASMTGLLDVREGMKVLEIGTGSGYQAAILAEMGCKVYTVEIINELAERAHKSLEELGYADEVEVIVGDGYKGLPEYAPFDRIIVTCAPEDVPDALKNQLKNGGKIVIPVGKHNEIQFLVVIEKNAFGTYKQDAQYPVRFVPMTGEAQKLK